MECVGDLRRRTQNRASPRSVRENKHTHFNCFLTLTYTHTSPLTTFTSSPSPYRHFSFISSYIISTYSSLPSFPSPSSPSSFPVTPPSLLSHVLSSPSSLSSLIPFLPHLSLTPSLLPLLFPLPVYILPFFLTPFPPFHFTLFFASSSFSPTTSSLLPKHPLLYPFPPPPFTCPPHLCDV